MVGERAHVVERQPAVDGTDGVTHGARQRRDLTRSPDVEGDGLRGKLQHRHVEVRARPAVEFFLFRVGNDSDHAHPLLVPEAQAAAERLAPRPEAFRHRLVDHYDALSTLVVGCRHVAATEDGRLKRAEVVGADEVVGGADTLVGGGLVSIHRDRGPRAAIEAQRNSRCHCDGAHTRSTADAVEQRPVESAHDLVAGGVRIEVEAGQQDTAGVEAGPNRARVDQATHAQPRGCQQHDRQGHLHHDQRRADPAAGAAGARRAVLQRVHQIAGGGRPGRKDSEQHGGDDPGQQREAQHRGVDRHLDADRGIGGRCKSHEQPGGPTGDQQRRRRAASREHEAFRKEQSHQVRAAGAKRHSDAELPPPAGRAHEQQVRQVRAGDEQDEPGDHGQHDQDRSQEPDAAAF